MTIGSAWWLFWALLNRLCYYEADDVDDEQKRQSAKSVEGWTIFSFNILVVPVAL